jgi:hypothetical protein
MSESDVGFGSFVRRAKETFRCNFGFDHNPGDSEFNAPSGIDL